MAGQDCQLSSVDSFFSHVKDVAYLAAMEHSAVIVLLGMTQSNNDCQLR